jgi:polyhydroxybutyrate depolymerase
MDGVIIENAMPGTPRPTIVFLHGGGGSGAQFQHSAAIDRELSARGIVAIYPSGERRHWNDGFMGRARETSSRNDVHFLDTMLDFYVAQKIVDPSRLYIAGISNGGMMTQRMLCASRYTFSGALVAVATHPDIGRCKNPRITPLQIMWGSEDQFFPPDGKRGNVWNDRNQPTSRADTAAFWAKANGCLNEAAITATPLKTPNTSVRTYAYKNCVAPFTIYDVTGMGHTWPGATGLRYRKEGKQTPKGFSANDIIIRTWFGG